METQVSQEILQNLLSGFTELFLLVNWAFVALFVITAWVINSYAESKTKAGWLNWLTKINRGTRTFIHGILVAVIYAVLLDKYSKPQMLGYLIGIIVAMFLFSFLKLDKLANKGEKKILKTR